VNAPVARPPERSRRTRASFIAPTPRDTRDVGFNPFRAQRRQRADYVIVAVAAVVILGLVLWAAI
jgi:hypothetical protein